MGHLATIYGEQFEVSPEPADYWGWVKEGRYDHEWRAYRQWLSPEDTFIDLGAWVGSHSLFASTICDVVVSVEPDPVAFAILEKNLPPRIIRVNKAIAPGETIVLGSEALGWSTTRANRHAGANIGAWKEDQSFTAKCITLPWLLAEADNPLFIKMDIEGGEEEVIKDLAFFEERKPKLLIELHPWWWSNPSKMHVDLGKLRAIYRDSREIKTDTWMLLP